MVTMKNKTAQPELPTSLGIDEIQARISALLAHGRKLLAEQIELEQSGATEEAPTQTVNVEELTARLLAGNDPAARASLTPTEGSRLFVIKAERQAVEKAIHALNMKLPALFAARAEREFERRGAEWRDNIHETALVIARLQKLNRSRETLAKEIRRGAPLGLPGDFPSIKIGGFGYGGTSPGFTEFLELALKVGLVTPSEIEKERGDTKERY